MKRQNVRTLVLLTVTIGYLLFGAVIFDKIESEHEQAERMRLEKLEEDLKKKLNITNEDFETLRTIAIDSKPYKAGIQWKFAGGLYFALSVITTIGYGHSTPITLAGKIFCICYATVGIPLNIVMFQSIGERFNVFLAYLIGSTKRCLHFRNVKVGELESIVMGGMLCGLVLMGGAAAFQSFEHWSYVESFYFCFITMSTIGFGDYVALQNETSESLQTQPGYVTFCIVYILCGLTVFAAALNKMVLGLLTMNTADERKDELQAQEDAMRSPTLEGDVIVANGSCLHDITTATHPESHRFSSDTLVVSARHPSLSSRHALTENGDCLQSFKCTYLKPAIKRKRFPRQLKFPKLRYSAKRRPCQSVTHLLPIRSVAQTLPAQSGGTPLLDNRSRGSQMSFLSLNDELHMPDTTAELDHQTERELLERL